MRAGLVGIQVSVKDKSPRDTLKKVKGPNLRQALGFDLTLAGHGQRAEGGVVGGGGQAWQGKKERSHTATHR